MLASGWGRDGLCHYGQLDYETAAYWFIFFDADGTAMIFDDSADDRESEAGAALFGREIGEKQPLFYVARDAMSGVGDGQFDDITVCQQCGRNRNFLQHRVLHGLGGVIDQIGY